MAPQTASPRRRIADDRRPQAGANNFLWVVRVVTHTGRAAGAHCGMQCEGTMLMKRSEFLNQATRLRALMADATTARARQHLEEQARQNDKLADDASKRGARSVEPRRLKQAA
jgi:hypothetical protein